MKAPDIETKFNTHIKNLTSLKDFILDLHTDPETRTLYAPIDLNAILVGCDYLEKSLSTMKIRHNVS